MLHTFTREDKYTITHQEVFALYIIKKKSASERLLNGVKKHCDEFKEDYDGSY